MRITEESESDSSISPASLKSVVPAYNLALVRQHLQQDAYLASVAAPLLPADAPGGELVASIAQRYDRLLEYAIQR